MALLDDRTTAGAAGASDATSDATVVLGNRAGGTGAAGAVDSANAAAAMGSAADAGVALKSGAGGVANTGAGRTGVVALTTVKVSYKDKTNETQANIILPSPTANLAKELHKNPIEKQSRLVAHIHTFVLQYSPNITHLNDS